MNKETKNKTKMWLKDGVFVFHLWVRTDKDKEVSNIESKKEVFHRLGDCI